MKKEGNARYVTLIALIKFSKQSGYSNLVLGNVLKSSGLSKRDKKFVTTLFYGVIERKLTLEFMIGKYSRIPISKLDTEVLIILQTAFYQLLFMKDIPESAVVNESVILAKMVGKSFSSGFINAVLRNFIRAGGKLELPAQDSVNYKEVKYSCSKNLITFWEDAYGKEKTDLILKNCFMKKNLTIRTNIFKTNTDDLLSELRRLGINAIKSSVDENAIVADSVSEIFESRIFKDSLFHVQGLTSQLCCKIFDAKPGEIIFDMCAAPGGKSFTIAQYMENRGKLFAFDIHKHRIELLKRNAEKLSVNIINASCADATKINPGDFPKADKVLCDVPCSGLGMISQKPELKYRETFKSTELVKIQYDILCKASELLKPGGKIIYSTCTLNPRENNMIVNKFISENQNFRFAPISNYEPTDQSIFENNSQITVFPSKIFCEGFFIAQLEKIK